MTERVLQVVTHMNRGGLETMLMNYYRHMDRSRVQFDFLVHREARADYDNEIEAMGGRIYRLPPLNPLSGSYRKALNAFFDAHPEYRVIHVHQDCMSSVILKAAEEHGLPVRIAHSHSSSQDRNLKYPIKLFFKRYIPRYATDLMACGEAAGSWMFSGAPFQVLNNAIDAERYRIDAEKRAAVRVALEIAAGETVVGHVGRFSYPKNHGFLIDVFAETVKHRPAKLLLVGDGTLRSEAEQKVRELKLERYVIFTGVRSDVADLMQAMDVFVFPSHYEGLPVTLIEAQAAGLPCLISENVPIECKKTRLVQQLSLSEGAAAWADATLELAAVGRQDGVEAIRAAGYDIVENAKRLQEYYLRAAAGEKQICQF